MTFRDALNWIVLILVIAGASGALYYKYEGTRPCAEPIAYTVGALDPRFGVATPTIIAEAKAAAAIWNKAAGKEVLVYQPEGAVPINLIYDEREEAAKLGGAITKAQDALDSDTAAIDALRAQYEEAQAAYNLQVEAANARGGAKLREYTALETKRVALNALADEVNSRITSHNQEVAALNAQAEAYNQTVGHTFEEGDYVSDSQGTRINIFEFVGETQLERVLAHELGHAIGLAHNNNPDSIMYAKNESGNLKPTADDLAALKALCNL